MEEEERGVERERERATDTGQRTAQETSIPTLLSSAKLSLWFFSAMEHCLSSCRDMDPTPDHLIHWCLWSTDSFGRHYHSLSEDL